MKKRAPYPVLLVSLFALLLLGAGCQPLGTASGTQAATTDSRPSRQLLQQARTLAERAPGNQALAYAPVIPEHRPIVTIRLAMHVFQDEQGAHNFQDTPAHRAILQSFVDQINHLYGNLAPHEPFVDSLHLADSRIRFQLEEIYFYQGRRGYDMNEAACGPYHQCGPNLYRQFVTDNPKLSDAEKEGRLHILMGENPYEDQRFQTGGSASGLGSKQFILARGYYWYYFHHPHLDWARNFIPTNIAHELGHNLGLSHTFEAGVCDSRGGQVRLPSGSSNNLLDYGSWQSLTPCQIGRMHQAIENNLGNLQDVVVRDFCQTDPQATLRIRPGEEVLWAAPRRLKGDLVVEEGAKLTLRARVGMPAGSRVQVKKGGWLVVEAGGELSGNCNQPWDRLQVENGDTRFKTFSDTGFPRNHGFLERR